MEGDWSADCKMRTFEVLGNIDFDVFSNFNLEKCKGCTMKSLDKKCGYVTKNDALNHDWKIFDSDDDHLLNSFHSLNALVEAGWVVG